MKIVLSAALLTLAAGSALADPVTYQIDPSHTYPSFEADHMGGLSVWRGKFDKSSGTIVYDKDKGAGTVDITVDTASINFGNPKLNEHAKSSPTCSMSPSTRPRPTRARSTNFKNGAPTQVQGQFTLHGVTHPLTLTVNSFKCMINPMSKKEVCGADASASFQRSDYGMNFGDKYGFKMDVKLQIQVEAIRAD